MRKTLAIGACYIDIEAKGVPFDASGIPANAELVGGDYRTIAGGSAVNFCRVLQQLGIGTTFIGLAGEDYYAQLLEYLMKEAGVVPALVYKKGVSTNVSFNLTNRDGDLHNMFVAGTANAALDADTVLPKLREVARDVHTVYLGGCFKLKHLQPVFGEIASIAESNDSMLVVDHGRIPPDTSEESLIAVKNLVEHAAYYLPSREEFCTLWGVDSVDDGLRLLYDRVPHLIVVVKDGSNGAYYLANNRAENVPAASVAKITSLTGAGDSFNAGFVAAITREQPIAKAVAFGCSVAAAKLSGHNIPKL